MIFSGITNIGPSETPAFSESVDASTEPKRKRARTDKGHFKTDDPATPADEAWVDQ
jgi:hypothetical protein